MNRIRILHIAQCAGGVDCYLRMLLAHMDKSRFEQILVGSMDYSKEVYEGLVDRFVQIYMCNSLSLGADCRAVIAVRGLIKKLRPNIIYCHSSKAGGIGRIANIGLGVPIVYNPHGWAFNMQGYKLKNYVYLIIEKLLAKLTTKFVAISYYEKLSAIENHVAKEERIKVIFNGVDPEAIKKQLNDCPVTRAMLGIPENAYLIGMVGRISTQKAPDTFIKVAQRLKSVIPNVFFIIVGDGDKRGEVELQITNAGLEDRVIITGWVDNPIAYSALFDQAVLLSRWEGFGLVLAEYMELGKPIVATEVNAIPDLITDHENGLLVDVDNDKQAVVAIMEIYVNLELKQKLINSSMMRVRSFFYVKRVASEHERLFLKIIGNIGK